MSGMTFLLSIFIGFSQAQSLGHTSHLPLSRSEVQACRHLVDRVQFYENCKEDFKTCQQQYANFYASDGTRTDKDFPRFQSDKFNIVKRLINDYGAGGVIGASISWTLYPAIIRYLPAIMRALRFGGPAAIVAAEGAAWSITPAMILILGGSQCAVAKETGDQSDMAKCASRIGEQIEKYFLSEVDKAIENPTAFKIDLHDPQQSLKSRFVCTALELRAKAQEENVSQAKCYRGHILSNGQIYSLNPDQPQVISTTGVGTEIQIDVSSGDISASQGLSGKTFSKLKNSPHWMFQGNYNFMVNRLADLAVNCQPQESQEASGTNSVR